MSPRALAVVTYGDSWTDRGVLARDGRHLVVYWHDGHVDPVRRDPRGWYWHREHRVRLPVWSRRRGEIRDGLRAWAAAWDAGAEEDPMLGRAADVLALDAEWGEG